MDRHRILYKQTSDFSFKAIRNLTFMVLSENFEQLLDACREFRFRQWFIDKTDKLWQLLLTFNSVPTILGVFLTQYSLTEPQARLHTLNMVYSCTKKKFYRLNVTGMNRCVACLKEVSSGRCRPVWVFFDSPCWCRKAVLSAMESSSWQPMPCEI